MGDVGMAQFSVKLHEEDGKGCCHFPDILQRLHKEGQKYIAAALAAAKDSKQQRALAHDEIGTWLQYNRTWAYPEKPVATSPCICHGKYCPTWPGLVDVDDLPADPWRINCSGIFVFPC